MCRSYHFLGIGLKKEEPRAGKRKPIEESEDEEEQKKVFSLAKV